MQSESLSTGAEKFNPSMIERITSNGDDVHWRPASQWINLLAMTQAAGNDSPDKLLSPAMRQYQQFKAQYPGYVLFFRMGDFYEMFWEDAKLAAKTLGVALTSRSKGGLEGEDAIPMAVALGIWAGRRCRVPAYGTAHSTTEPARPPEARVLPSGEKAN